jgi:hypothetical protein
MDYNTLANGQALRAAIDELDAEGRNDQVEYEGLLDAGTGDFQVSAPTPPNLVLGALVEWSQQLQTAGRYSIQVTTAGWRNRCYASVDRNFIIRPGNKFGEGTMIGGMFAFLFAQRMEASDTCGWPSGGGCTVQAEGGMQQSMAQLAFVAPYTSVTEVAVEIPGTTLIGAEPTLTVSVPTSFAAGFGCQVRYITAASTSLAQVRAALRL